ncbi:pilus assembly protein [Sneathiella marina]|uniref:Pilus assembly protein n=1 Tax=Sneathiella marina TaxID=2950108 RepID=A0ABY4W6Y7_9PROT|nr:TadE/TadG family type IV pilus assembly protein [Sneathiella marina]USG62937.1 pilus assembly protein [Sneathiella marina]
MKTLLRNLKDRSVDGIYSFIRNRRGVAMVEFAMLLPLLMLLAAGSFEVARYALIMQKLDRIVATLSDLVARSGNETMTETEVSNIMDSAFYMAQPFDITGDAMMILTSVEGRAGQAPQILSQRSSGTVAGAASTIGTTINGNATLPSAFPDAGSGETLNDGETLIVAELVYNYSPYLIGNIGFFGDQVFYRNAFFRPRFTDKIEFPVSP